MIRISHHRVKCIGCNYCVEVAPSNWIMDKTDGKSTLLDAKEKRGFIFVLLLMMILKQILRLLKFVL